MKSKKEIVSLNSIRFEGMDGMGINESLEMLVPEEMKRIIAGDDCQWMDYYGCERMCDGVNEYYCPTQGCTSHNCPPNGDMICPPTACGTLCYELGCSSYSDWCSVDGECFTMLT